MSDILKIKFNDDGTVSINATGVKGSEVSILAKLKSLAASVGGDLKVERHVHGAHAHHHEEGADHVHE